MLTTAHMEHGLPLLAEFDIQALLGAGDAATVLEVLAKAGASRSVRRLAAVHRATVEELLEAEVNPKKALEMEAAVARLTFSEAFQDALRFFQDLGPALSELVPSVALPGEEQGRPLPAAGSPSAAS